jgi:DNA-binding LytR/AlgR family response regulator
MILYRFSDAVNELSNRPGQQVHRSYWVSKSAIKAVNAKAKDFYLLLENGEKIPVSGPYQGHIREALRTAKLPLQN